MKEKITVIVKNPGEPAEEREIPNTLEALQGIVGGYIETVRFASDCTIVCNEEGKLREMEPNIFLMGEMFVGPVILVGTRQDEFDDVPMPLELFLELIPALGR